MEEWSGGEPPRPSGTPPKTGGEFSGVMSGE